MTLKLKPRRRGTLLEGINEDLAKLSPKLLGRGKNPKATMKELTITLVFTGRTSATLDDLIEQARRGFALGAKHVWPPRWSKELLVRLKRWEARDLTLHPRGGLCKGSPGRKPCTKAGRQK